MKNLTVRFAVTTLAGVALLSACGAPYSTSTVPPSVGVQGKMHKPSGSSGALLYAVNYNSSEVTILSYPAGQYVGAFSVPNAEAIYGECSDPAGNVFLLAQGRYFDSSVVEYPHGGTQPIATLNLPEEDPNVWTACAWDPTTGNLAVTNVGDVDEGTVVAVFANEQGNATTYTCPYLYDYYGAAYDGNGNLFINVSNYFCELAKGSGTFTLIRAPSKVNAFSIQWDGAHIAAYSRYKRRERIIYRLDISASGAKIIGTTKFKMKKVRWFYPESFWIASNTVALALGKDGVAVYGYPNGGNAEGTIYGYNPTYITVSVAPSR